MSIQWEIISSPKEVAQFVALRIENIVRRKPNCAIAIPTGKTPLVLYEILVNAAKQEPGLFSDANWFALDEFLGQGIPAESTFAHLLRTRFIRPAGIPEDHFHALPANPEKPDRSCAEYEKAISASGGLELALLGLGLNGHLAFNEPGTELQSRTGVRVLTEASRKANSYLFAGGLSATPHRALSMGLGTVLSARHIVLMAVGASKADPVGRLKQVDGWDPTFPASGLYEHRDAIIVVDVDAASAV